MNVMEKQFSIDREAPRKLFPTSNSQPRVYASVSRNEKSGDVSFKVVNATPQAVQASLQFKGARMLGRKGTETFLAGNLADENSFEYPKKVAPVTTPFPRHGKRTCRFLPATLADGAALARQSPAL